MQEAHRIAQQVHEVCHARHPRVALEHSVLRELLHILRKEGDASPLANEHQ